VFLTMFCALSMSRISVERQWKGKPHLKELPTVDVVLQDQVIEASHFPVPLGELLPLHLQLLLVTLPALLHLLKPAGLHCQLALRANVPSVRNWHKPRLVIQLVWCEGRRVGT